MFDPERYFISSNPDARTTVPSSIINQFTAMSPTKIDDILANNVEMVIISVMFTIPLNPHVNEA